MATLDEFCSEGWRDHATDAAAVFARLPQGVELVTEARHAPMLAALVVHVAGEHLGRWDDGLALLERVESLPVLAAGSPEAKSVARSKAVLHRCAGHREAEALAMAAGTSGGGAPAASDRIRVLAIAAAALVGQKRMAEARADFEACLELAAYGPTKTDPAARAVAVTAHNIAVEFENTAVLDDECRSLMIRAAEISRHFWLIAGGWMEAERAEYRLAMTHLKAGNASTALGHARRCLAIVEENGSDPGEAFFAHEAISRSLVAANDVAAARTERDAMAAILPTITDEEFRSFAAEELAKLDAALV